ncbi:MAG: hypothetical protein PHZ25_02300 [Candidatus Pacebacteria bacterium]|nr:hypothetical protein [Candidatus Paceibacterota bacterium]
MIYKLSLAKSNDKFIKKIFQESMKDLGEFYGINWTTNTPKIILLEDRKSIDLLHVKKTESWLVGWADNNMRIVFILDKKNFEKFSSHKYSTAGYSALIKHELSHLFYKILSEGKFGPAWLSEGVAIYTSGQNKLKTKPREFKNFMSFYAKGGSEVYKESGFAVELLVKKFGKNKLFELIKSLQSISNENQFNKTFKKIYGFQISYKVMNKFYKNTE